MEESQAVETAEGDAMGGAVAGPSAKRVKTSSSHAGLSASLDEEPSEGQSSAPPRAGMRSCDRPQRTRRAPNSLQE